MKQFNYSCKSKKECTANNGRTQTNKCETSLIVNKEEKCNKSTYKIDYNTYDIQST